MQTTPGHVIRVLRHALKMSQREFAQALGWAPSTISRWERDEAPPTRLALKTILAFAEERGVRYRPKPPPSARALVPLHDHPIPGPPHQAGASAPPTLCEISTARGSRVPGERFLSITAERPRWRAEANFRLSPGEPPPRRSRTALNGAGIIAAGLCIVLTIGLPGSPEHPSAPLLTPEPALHSLKIPSSVPGSVGHARQPLPSAALSRATPSHAIAQDAAAVEGSTPAPVPAPTPAPLARLESIVMIGDAHRATFRTEAAAITVTEGGWLAGQQVELIEANHVELVSSAGDTRTVRIGTPIPLD